MKEMYFLKEMHIVKVKRRRKMLNESEFESEEIE